MFIIMINVYYEISLFLVKNIAIFMWLDVYNILVLMIILWYQNRDD